MRRYTIILCSSKIVNDYVLSKKCLKGNLNLDMYTEHAWAHLKIFLFQAVFLVIFFRDTHSKYPSYFVSTAGSAARVKVATSQS